MENKFCTLITGACGGLGRAFVKILAQNKENLVLTGTSKDKLDLLLKDFENEFKDIFVKTIVCDLSKKEDRNNLMNDLKKSNLKINKLINNAGVIIEGDLLRFSNEEIEKAIMVNCVGTLELTKMIAENRDESQKLEILTVSSQASFQAIPHMGVYAATKSFLTSMMTALKVEWKKKNIVVTTVCPSGIATNKEMIESIKSMGISGKLTTLPVEKVAKISLKALKKKKAVVIPGAINKILNFFSKFCSPYFLAKTTGNIWKKSQHKRGFWYKIIIFFQNTLDKKCYVIIIRAMEQTITQERNIFSKGIIELKLISDRIAEGKGESAGIFSNTYQILYILTRKEKVTPKELIAELNMAKSNLAILAKKMIKDGLMESHKEKSNKREIFYNITEDGKAMLQEKLDNVDTVCEGDTKKVINIVYRAVEELKKLENKNSSQKRRKTNAK